LSDAQWARIEPLVPGTKGERGRTATGTRLCGDAILWLAQSAAGTGQLAHHPLPLPTLDTCRV
jgi:transposase